MVASMTTPIPPRPLAHSTGFLLAWVAATAQKRYEEAIGRVGLTAHEVGTLTLVAAQPQPQARLAEHLGLFSAHIVRVVESLEQRGLVGRSPVPGDRRASAIHATASGEEALAQAEAAGTAATDEILGVLGRADLAQLDRILRRLAGIDE